MDRFKHIRTKIRFVGRAEPIDAIVDTGSNCSLIQETMLSKPKKKEEQKIPVDFPTVDDAMGSLVDLNVEELASTDMDGKSFTFIVFPKLSRVIPGYPEEAPVLIGTNLLSGHTLEVSKRSPYVKLGRHSFNVEETESIFQVPTPKNQHCGPVTKLNGPFVLCETNTMGSFLADTGNLRSTFCIECEKIDKVSISLQKRDGKSGVVVEVAGIKNTKTKAESIKTVENNCKVLVSGNLSKDVWVGVFDRTFFDFTARTPQIFCEYTGNK